MNWKLIVLLSLLGLIMALATISLIPENIEPYIWAVVILVSAWILGRMAPGRYVVHGICLGLLNCIWVTAAHILMSKTYLPNHPSMVASMAKWPMAEHPRRMMALTGPIIGLISGIVIGLLALVVSMITKKKPAAA